MILRNRILSIQSKPDAIIPEAQAAAVLYVWALECLVRVLAVMAMIFSLMPLASGARPQRNRAVISADLQSASIL